MEEAAKRLKYREVLRTFSFDLPLLNSMGKKHTQVFTRIIFTYINISYILQSINYTISLKYILYTKVPV